MAEATEFEPEVTGQLALGRFLVLSGLAFTLVFAGLLSMNGGPLVLAIPLLVYLTFTLFNRPPDIQLTANRTVTQEMVQQYSLIQVKVEITNHGPDLEEALIEDHLPNGLQLVEGKTRVLTSLPAGTTFEMNYTVRARRGRYFLQDILVSASDHLGVSRKRVLLPARKKLLFLPQVTRLRKISIRPQRTHGHFGPIPSRKTGSGVDFYGLREYQMGDPRRWINWRANARHDQLLFVNQFEQERIADVGIILDARQQSNIILPNGESLFEYGVLAAGSVSEALLNMGNKVGLVIYGYGMERVFPGYGKVQQKRILRALGQARTGHNFALESLGSLPTRFFPYGSQIVMISPLVSSDVPAFARLRANGYEIVVISPDPVAFEAGPDAPKGEVAVEIARVERVLTLRKLQRMGIRILDWPIDRPFEPLVRATLSRLTPGRVRGTLR